MNTGMDEIRYEKFDGCYGKVTSRNASGSYITLDNGELAFAFGFYLFSGSSILCTVLRPAVPEEGKRARVSVDTVMEYTSAVA